MGILKLLSAMTFGALRRPVMLLQAACWAGGAYVALDMQSVWPVLIGAGLAFLVKGIAGDAPL